MQKEMKSIKGAVANSKSIKPQRTITCNFCKKKGHIKKDCYSYQSWLKRSKWKAKQKANPPAKSDSSRDKDVSRTGVSRKASEASIFVDATINGSRVKCLIDTGATVSMISPRILHSVMKDSQIALD